MVENVSVAELGSVFSRPSDDPTCVYKVFMFSLILNQRD